MIAMPGPPPGKSRKRRRAEAPATAEQSVKFAVEDAYLWLDRAQAAWKDEKARIERGEVIDPTRVDPTELHDSKRVIFDGQALVSKFEKLDHVARSAGVAAVLGEGIYSDFSDLLGNVREWLDFVVNLHEIICGSMPPAPAAARRAAAAAAEKDGAIARALQNAPFVVKRHTGKRPAFDLSNPESLGILHIDAKMDYAEIANFMNAQRLGPNEDGSGVRAHWVQKMCIAHGYVRRPRASEETHEMALAHMRFLMNHNRALGVTKVMGALKSAGIQVTEAFVRANLPKQDHAAAAVRLHRAVRRRVYSVAGAQVLWHSDGCHHLVQYGIVLHGCIDGFSRKIMWFAFRDNNSSDTVGELHRRAILEHGLPRVIRTDYGFENSKIWATTNALRDLGYRVKFIRGRSVHNQRIERLWRDAHDVTDELTGILTGWERSGILNIENAEDLLAMHYVILPYANEIAQRWVNGAWNSHRMRTMRASPNTVWDESVKDRAAFVEGVQVDEAGNFLPANVPAAERPEEEANAAAAIDDDEFNREHEKMQVVVNSPRTNIPWWDEACADVLQECVEVPTFASPGEGGDPGRAPEPELCRAYQEAKAVIAVLRQARAEDNNEDA